MATRKSRRDEGRERGRDVESGVLKQLREARVTANVSQAAAAALLGWPQSRYCDFERGLRRVTVRDVCEVAAVLGLEGSISLRRKSEGLRDRGQVRLIARLERLLSPLWQLRLEVPFPNLHDLRSWDALLKLGEFLVGVEAETRLRDQQEFVRRIRQRETHGGVDQILIVLSDSAHNRELVAGLREALGERYGTPVREIRAALREGRPLPGSGVILL